MKILSFEANPPKRDFLATYFRQKASVVDEVSDPADLPDMLSIYGYDALIVRLSEERLSDIGVIGQIKAAHNIPIVMVAKSLGNESRLAALQAGADDLIVAPLSHEEVFLKVQNLVRRTSGFARPTVQLGAAFIDMPAKNIYANGVQVKVTNKEYMVIEALLLNGGVMSKQALLDRLYGENDDKPAKIVDVFVCKIRRKMKSAGVEEFIETRWGQGYAIVGMTPDLPPTASHTNIQRDDHRVTA